MDEVDCYVCSAYWNFVRWSNLDFSPFSAAQLKDSVRAQYDSLLGLLGVTHEEFLHFVFFNVDSGKRPLTCLIADRDSFKQWLEERAAVEHCPCLCVHRQITHYGFFLCYFMAVYLWFEPSPLVFKYIQIFFKHEQLTPLLFDFSWVLKKFTLYVFQVEYDHPIIRLNNANLDSFLFLKKKSGLKMDCPALTVPAPSWRTTGRDRCDDCDVTTHETSLSLALMANSRDVPCGNPFECMVQSLAFRACLLDWFCVVPVNTKTVPVVHNIYLKVLNHFILSCVVRLPILDSKIELFIKKKKAHVTFVYCNECKHCLNFGKGKFTKVNFKPTQVFYCRDQREKQSNICGTTGRINCSFCGSSDICTGQLTEHVSNVSVLRAVLANNAAFMLDDVKRTADFLLPCLGNKGKCGGSVLKKLTVGQLLYLTSSVQKLLCTKCQNL